MNFSAAIAHHGGQRTSKINQSRVGPANNGRGGDYKAGYGPVTFTTARTAKRPSTSNAALIIRMSCVLGSTNRHTKAKVVAISDMRNAKNRILLNIDPKYPILTRKSRQKCPALTAVLARRYNKHSGGQFAKFHVISIFWRPADC